MDHPRICGEHSNRRVAISPTQNHPRTCEEHHKIAQMVCVVQGTPPRMRGIHQAYRRVVLSTGVIPVNSGNTWFLKRTKICQGSSPHMRGIPLRPLAHSDATEPPPRIAGNAPFTIQEEPTPPMRGTHHFSTVGAAIVRRTPAYAGSTNSI